MSQDFATISEPLLDNSCIKISTKDELLKVLSAAMRQDYAFLSNKIIVITNENINAICNKIINIVQELPCIIMFRSSTYKHPYFTVYTYDCFKKYDMYSIGPTYKFFNSFDNFLIFNSSPNTISDSDYTFDDTDTSSHDYTFTDSDKNIIHKFFEKYAAQMGICTPETSSLECKCCKFSSDNTHVKQGYCSTLCIEDWDSNDIDDFINTVISSDSIFIKPRTDIYKKELQGILDSETKRNILSTHEADAIERVIKLLDHYKLDNNLYKENE